MGNSKTIPYFNVLIIATLIIKYEVHSYTGLSVIATLMFHCTENHIKHHLCSFVLQCLTLEKLGMTSA